MKQGWRQYLHKRPSGRDPADHSLPRRRSTVHATVRLQNRVRTHGLK